jgi:squalene-hopene/tetraprenyl-beta-curcumene cyclase
VRNSTAEIGLTLCVFTLVASAAAQPAQTLVRPPDISFRHEVEHAIDQSVQWLQSSQNTNGWWSTADQPAVTALALTALMGEPSGATRAVPPAVLARGYQFIIGHAKPDGSIYEKDMATVNTSICMMGLLAARNPRYDPLLRKARQWLIAEQVAWNAQGKKDWPFDGGVGDGAGENRSDIDNTMTALEALYYSKYLDAPEGNSSAGAKELNWAAALHFIESCQNLPGRNKKQWFSTDQRDIGGFVDVPGDNNAGGPGASHLCGSETCAGFLSYIYAGAKPDDPRVLAAYDWLRNHFTLDENPGMGRQGLYVYLHLMTKALASFGMDQLPLKNGQTIDWRRELAMKLLNAQNADGSWTNQNVRGWDDDPAVATSYSVISLEILYGGL